MFHVVELNKSCGGGLGIVREEWLTPGKKECYWPPFKHADKFNEWLTCGEHPTDEWALFPIGRLLYTTDDLLKARRKLEAADSESELVSDDEYPLKRKRKLRRRSSLSSDEGPCDNNSFTTKEVCRPNTPKIVHVNSVAPPAEEDDLLKTKRKLKAAESESQLISDDEYPLRRLRKLPRRSSLNSNEGPCDNNSSTTEEVCRPNTPKIVHVNGVAPPAEQERSSEVASQSQNESLADRGPILRPLMLYSQASQQESDGRSSGVASQSQNESLTDRGPVLRPLMLYSQASQQESDALNNIASALAKVEKRLSEIEANQKRILEKLVPSIPAPLELPPQIHLPCESIPDVNSLEEWLMSQDNAKALTASLSVLGGKTTAHSVRRILQKIFSNQVAVLFNWTGKYSKCALKDLTITKIIPGIVRRNKNAADATDAEIHSMIANWFRFSKDRDGGRNNRIKIRNCE